MNGTTRRRVGVLLGAVTVVAAAATVSSVRASDAPDVTVSKDAGIIRLRTGGGSVSITYTGPLSLPAQTMSVSSKCEVTTNGSVLSIVSSNTSFRTGLVNNGLGVRAKNNCSTSEGRISADESLTIALSSNFPSDVRITSAELDIEGKFGAALGVQVDGGTTVDSYPLADAADNGPDSGASDNDRVEFATSARSLKLTSIGGELSLEGGGDGTYAAYVAEGAVGTIGQTLGTADTILQLMSSKTYDRGVECNETVPADDLGDAASTASFTRGLNDDPDTGLSLPPEECDEEIGVTFAILDNGVLLDKSTAGVDTGTEQNPTGTVTITWAVQNAYPLADIQINYDGDPDGVFELVKWCEGSDATGYIHPADNRFPGGVLPWCLVSDSAVVQPGGGIVQTQVYDGWGDPLWQTSR